MRKVKEESEKVALKLNIQKTKIMEKKKVLKMEANDHVRVAFNTYLLLK